VHRGPVLAMAGIAVALALPVHAAGPVVRWEKSPEEAARRAKKEGRPLVILFTSERLQLTTRRYRFTGRQVRNAVARANAICAKVVQPAPPDAARIVSPGNANIGPLLRLARKEYKEKLAAFDGKTAQYGVKRLPSVVFAYPEGDVFCMLRAPRDEEIVQALRRLKATPLASMADSPPGDPDPGAAGPTTPATGAPPAGEVDDLEVAARVDPFESDVDPEDF